MLGLHRVHRHGPGLRALVLRDCRRCPIGVERGLQRVGIDRTHDVGRDDDHQLGLVALEAVALEQGAEDRQVAEAGDLGVLLARRSEEHTSELQSLMRISYAVFCLKKKKMTHKNYTV